MTWINVISQVLVKILSVDIRKKGRTINREKEKEMHTTTIKIYYYTSITSKLGDQTSYHVYSRIYLFANGLRMYRMLF